MPALDPTPTTTGSLQAFFANLSEHDGLYRSLLGPQGSARVIDHVRRRVAAAVHANSCHATPPADIGSSIDIPHDVPAAFVAGAIIGVAADWLQRGCPRTPAEMASLTGPLLTAHFGADAGAPRCET